MYGACFVVIRAALAYAPPLLLAGLRASLAGAALLALAAVAGRPLLRLGVGWGSVAALALTSTSVGFGTMFVSQVWATASLASVLGNLQPLFVTALAVPLLGERLGRRNVAALGLGIAGVTLAIGPSAAFGVGPALALASSVSLAGGNLILKRLGDGPDLLALSAWQLVLGALPLLAASAVAERGSQVDLGPDLALVLALLALPGTALPYLAWNWAVRRHEVGRLTTFLFLAPAFGVLLSAVALGDRLPEAGLLGVALVLAAAFLALGGEARTVSAVRPPMPPASAGPGSYR